MKVENSCHSFQTLCQKEKFLDIVCNKNLDNLTCSSTYTYLLDNTVSTCLLIQFLFASSSNKYSTLSFNILLSSCCYYYILWTRTWHLSYLIPFFYSFAFSNYEQNVSISSCSAWIHTTSLFSTNIKFCKE